MATPHEYLIKDFFSYRAFHKLRIFLPHHLRDILNQYLYKTSGKIDRDK